MTLLALFGSSGPGLSVDLTPRFTDNLIGGVMHRSFFFADGDRRRIGLTLGFDTRVEPGAGGAVFRFTNLPEATFLIKHSSMSAEEPFAGLALDRYREAAHRLLPPGAVSIQLLEETSDPLTGNHWPSHRYLFLYRLNNADRKSTVVFANVSTTEQILLITSADAGHFEEAAERAWLIVRTWQPYAVPVKAPAK